MSDDEEEVNDGGGEGEEEEEEGDDSNLTEEQKEKKRKKLEKREKKYMSALIQKKNELERFRRNEIVEIETKKKKEIAKLGKVLERVREQASADNQVVDEINRNAKKEKDKVAKLNKEQKKIKDEIAELEVEMAKMNEINTKLQDLSFNGDQYIEQLEQQLVTEKRKNEMLSRNYTKLVGGVNKLSEDAKIRGRYCEKENKLKTIYVKTVAKIIKKVESLDTDQFEDEFFIPELLEKNMKLKEKYENNPITGFTGEKLERFFHRN